MSELILYTTKDGRSQIKDGALAAAVVKDSLTAQFSKRRVTTGLCAIVRATAEESSVVDECWEGWS